MAAKKKARKKSAARKSGSARASARRARSKAATTWTKRETEISALQEDARAGLGPEDVSSLLASSD